MLRALVLTLALLAAFAARAGEVQVAAASELAGTIEKIAAAFQRDTGHQAVVFLATTSRLEARIRAGEALEVLLAGDQQTPARLLADGLARPESRFTYAIGRLVLWSPQEGGADARGEVLKRPPAGRLALPDPRESPYGVAAMEALRNLGVLATWQPQLQVAEDVDQAYQLASGRKAQLAFVSLSQVAELGRVARGSGWLVPPALYEPLQQDAVLLNAGVVNPAATTFLAYLRSNAARAILRNAGYGF